MDYSVKVDKNRSGKKKDMGDFVHLSINGIGEFVNLTKTWGILSTLAKQGMGDLVHGRFFFQLPAPKYQTI